MPSHRSPASLQVFVLASAALALILSCRAEDLINSLRAQRAAGAPTVVAARPTRAQPSPTVTAGALSQAPTAFPSDTAVPTAVPTATPSSLPTETFTPGPTNTPLPPTRRPPPTQTFTPEPPPAPTRCPQEYCVIKADCLPSENTRAIGTVYENGVPRSGVRVRVSYSYGGARVAEDFISGHDPINPTTLDATHPGYYQVGIREGEPFDGNWWVFLVDDRGQNPISEGRYFKTTDVKTSSSCQVGVTDFAK